MFNLRTFADKITRKLFSKMSTKKLTSFLSLPHELRQEILSYSAPPPPEPTCGSSPLGVVMSTLMVSTSEARLTAQKLLRRRIQLVAWAYNLKAAHPRLRNDVDYVLATCIRGDAQEALQFQKRFLAEAANRANSGGSHGAQFYMRVAEWRLDNIFMIAARDSQRRVWISWLLSLGDIPGTAGLTLRGRERLAQAVRHSLQRCQFLTQ